jgi:hypothetical protein
MTPTGGSVGMSFTAIPTRQALGTGQSSVLQGVLPQSSRYRLFIVETAGAPLVIEVALRDLRGGTVAAKQLFLEPDEQIRPELTDLFPNARLERGTIRVRGVNGHGRVILAGAHIAAGTEDPSAFEMSFTAEPRSRIRWPEASAYMAVALVVAIALVRKRVTSEDAGVGE